VDRETRGNFSGLELDEYSFEKTIALSQSTDIDKDIASDNNDKSCLDLTYNRFTAVPDSLHRMGQCLFVLDLSHNHISVPSGISDLPLLHTLL